eukprot:TRINITY_DN2487_c0_g1_i4.p1 TRINITY_DN2487_c0_g1~~TRINITY_DN2487_c0_g1_i4.p1  ORF type:complete len:496 (+),score=131.76 TRINITY_DN2487_c0_g1_i4:60-1490(+)
MRLAVLLAAAAVTSAAVNHTEELPSKCKVSVAGAGFSGVYFAWRLAVDTHRVAASDVCIFEANARIGGRLYSVKDFPEMSDIEVDVGAYRFAEGDHLPSDLIMKGLLLKTACYDYNCTGGGCSHGDGGLSTNCLKVTDVYGNSRFSLVIETMLEQLISKGAHLFTGTVVTGVLNGGNTIKNGRRTAILTFRGTDHKLHSDIVLMNTPMTALGALDQDSVIFPKAGGSEEAFSCMTSQIFLTGLKVYALYDDAWWYSKLGLMQGSYGTDKEAVPLSGRYQDGPTKCKVKDGHSGLPVYAESPVKYGDCWGALMVYYRLAITNMEGNYWLKMMADPDDAMTRIVPGGKHANVLADLHAQLMEFHAKELAAAGVDPASLAPPKAIYMGNFVRNGTYVGSIGATGCALTKPKKVWKVVRRPNEDYNVFLANQDYGRSFDTFGWATGGLQLTEKILQAEMGLRKPKWLNGAWYEKMILGVE